MAACLGSLISGKSLVLRLLLVVCLGKLVSSYPYVTTQEPTGWLLCIFALELAWLSFVLSPILFMWWLLTFKMGFFYIYYWRRRLQIYIWFWLKNVIDWCWFELIGFREAIRPEHTPEVLDMAWRILRPFKNLTKRVVTINGNNGSWTNSDDTMKPVDLASMRRLVKESKNHQHMSMSSSTKVPFGPPVDQKVCRYVVHGGTCPYTHCKFRHPGVLADNERMPPVPLPVAKVEVPDVVTEGWVYLVFDEEPIAPTPWLPIVSCCILMMMILDHDKWIIPLLVLAVTFVVYRRRSMKTHQLVFPGAPQPFVCVPLQQHERHYLIDAIGYTHKCKMRKSEKL